MHADFLFIAPTGFRSPGRIFGPFAAAAICKSFFRVINCTPGPVTCDTLQARCYDWEACWKKQQSKQQYSSQSRAAVMQQSIDPGASISVTNMATASLHIPDIVICDNEDPSKRLYLV